MRRFFIDGQLTPVAFITGNDARHISRVLRMRPGDKLAIAFSDGQAGEAVIENIKPGEITVRVVSMMHDRCTEPPVSVYLAQCLTKSDKMDYIVQKAVELGAAGIFPVVASHCVVNYDDAKKKARRDRWQKIAAEAAKQCGRNLIPQVYDVMNLNDVFCQISDDTVIVMLYEAEMVRTIRNILSGVQKQKYLILIGPEGGFSAQEVEQAKKHGAHVVTLGPRILRTETASLAALSIVMYEQGDLGG